MRSRRGKNRATMNELLRELAQSSQQAGFQLHQVMLTGIALIPCRRRLFAQPFMDLMDGCLKSLNAPVNPTSYIVDYSK